MGYYLFVHQGRDIAVRDFDLLVVRDALSRACEGDDLDFLRQKIESWQLHGPGVWSGIDGTELEANLGIFDRAIDALWSHGEEIPLDYLNGLVSERGMKWLVPQKTQRIVDLIDNLKGLFSPAPKCS